MRKRYTIPIVIITVLVALYMISGLTSEEFREGFERGYNEGMVESQVSASDGDDVVKADTTSLEPTTMTEAEIMESAKHIPSDISWRDLARSPDRYAGEMVAFYGNAGAKFGDDTVYIHNIPQFGYTNAIVVTDARFPDGSRVIGDDKVTVYGIVDGSLYSDNPVVRAALIQYHGVYSTADMMSDFNSMAP